MTKDNASGAGMETVAFLVDVAEHCDNPDWNPQDELVRRTDATRLLAESQTHNAKLEAQVERMQQALTEIAEVVPNGWHKDDGSHVAVSFIKTARAALKP